MAMVLLAGVGAGIINTIVGSGTLITFPTLLAVGIPPLSATVSNSIGLVPGGLAGSFGYRRELRGQGRRIRLLLPLSVLGALSGSFLLLHLPQGAFETVVPILVVLAIVLVIIQVPIKKRLTAVRAASAPRSSGRGVHHLEPVAKWLLMIAAYCAAVYGGYFAAAQGVLVLALFGIILPDSLQAINGLKNVLVATVNVVAGVTYIVVGKELVHWQAVGLVAVGALIGGLVGARIGRRLSPTLLRGTVVVLGVVALWKLLS